MELQTELYTVANIAFSIGSRWSSAIYGLSSKIKSSAIMLL